MKHRHVHFFWALLLAAGLAVWPSAASAQGGAKEKFQQAQKQNAAAQRRYTWLSRTELLLKGESKNVKVESVHYNTSGQIEKTVVESTPQQEQGGGRLKQRIVEKKKAEFQELMEGLGDLAQAYAHLSPEQMQALMQSASISQSQGEMQGTMRIQGTDVVVQGDTMTLNPAPRPFHGYYFRILTAQGAAAPGGAKSYITKGDMNGGFALVAWPADYGNSGVMTFLINQDGIVYEKDLGEETEALASQMKDYNPDETWSKAE
ncbi:MAG: DUF2950 family protein [Candidatus Acidiferrales bacterium]